MKKQNRRSFLQFLGRTGVGLGASAFLVNIQACTPTNMPKDAIVNPSKTRPFPLQDIQHSLEDKLVLANGLEYDVLIKWNDPISETDQFGFNNDYLAFIPFDKNNPNDGMLWVNHEYLQERRF